MEKSSRGSGVVVVSLVDVGIVDGHAEGIERFPPEGFLLLRMRWERRRIDGTALGGVEERLTLEVGKVNGFGRLGLGLGRGEGGRRRKEGGLLLWFG